MGEGTQIDKEARFDRKMSKDITSSMNTNGNSNAPPNLDLILDIPVTVSVELGKAKMIIHDILQLGQGSVVELDKLAGEPMEVLVQGRPVGKGEVVVVNEKFGIRLTDIISPVERIEKLK